VNKINDYLNNLKIHEHDEIDVIAHSCGGYFMTLFANKITNKNIKKFIILSPAGLIKMKNLPKPPLFFKVLWESYNFSLKRWLKMVLKVKSLLYRNQVITCTWTMPLNSIP